jgi:hypothetical protein
MKNNIQNLLQQMHVKAKYTEGIGFLNTSPVQNSDSCDKDKTEFCSVSRQRVKTGTLEKAYASFNIKN